MAITALTRAIWHSITDNLWASSAAAADAESTPNDGEIIAGHVNNTGYTSGRANYLWAFCAELGQQIRDSLYPQHQDNGDHNQIVVAANAAAEIGIDIESDAAEAGGQVKIRVNDAAGAPSFVVTSDGAAIPSQSYNLMACDFSPLSNHDDDDKHFERDSFGSYVKQEIGDGTTRELVSRTFSIPPGSRVTNFQMYTNRPTNNGQTLACALRKKPWNSQSTTLITTLTRNAGTGYDTTSQAGLSTDVTAGESVYVRCSLDNGAETSNLDVWDLTPVHINATDYYAGCSLDNDPSGAYIASYLSDGTATVKEIVEGLQAVLAGILPAAVAVATEDDTKITLSGPNTGQHIRPICGSSAAAATWTVTNTAVGGQTGNAIQLVGCRVECIPTP